MFLLFVANAASWLSELIDLGKVWLTSVRCLFCPVLPDLSQEIGEKSG